MLFLVIHLNEVKHCQPGMTADLLTWPGKFGTNNAIAEESEMTSQS
jgi:hypothetical protein